MFAQVWSSVYYSELSQLTPEAYIDWDYQIKYHPTLTNHKFIGHAKITLIISEH